MGSPISPLYICRFDDLSCMFSPALSDASTDSQYPLSPALSYHTKTSSPSGRPIPQNVCVALALAVNNRIRVLVFLELLPASVDACRGVRFSASGGRSVSSHGRVLSTELTARAVLVNRSGMISLAICSSLAGSRFRRLLGGAAAAIRLLFFKLLDEALPRHGLEGQKVCTLVQHVSGQIVQVQGLALML